MNREITLEEAHSPVQGTDKTGRVRNQNDISSIERPLPLEIVFLVYSTTKEHP